MKELIELLTELIAIKAERDKAFAECDCSWGYHGYALEEKLKKAEEEAAQKLNEIIDRKIDGIKEIK